MVEDLPLQLLQLGAGLEPELVGEPAPSRLVGGEGFGLTTGAIQRPHELGERSLAVRVLTHDLLELRHELGVRPSSRSASMRSSCASVRRSSSRAASSCAKGS